MKPTPQTELFLDIEIQPKTPEVKQDRKGQFYTACEGKNNDDSFIVHVKNANFEGFALKFKCQGKYYYQHLTLGCRGAAQSYFPAAKRLYRHIKKLSHTDYTFKRLAV